MKLSLTVGPLQEGRELKSLMKNELRLSVSLIRTLKAASGIYVNGKPVFTDYRVKTGDEVLLIITEPAADFPPEQGSLTILYEDEDLLAVAKPQGLIVHPSHSRLNGTLANYVLAYILDSGGESCHLINRLDRDTGGVVLFSKSAYVKSLMTGSITVKEYLAVVCGRPKADSGIIEQPIRRAREGDMLRIVAPDGDYSRTDYELIDSAGGLSLLRLRLHTGRTHQIRVHLSYLGCPILGDRLYGTEESRSVSEKEDTNMQQLHARKLVFTHPFSGKSIELCSEPAWEILAKFKQ
ncbi:MAG: RluA family pseudouridine synthase [Papillibacter sp.]|nr:RluA family pseudouridine synthase [Papillibacter sp.]